MTPPQATSNELPKEFLDHPARGTISDPIIINYPQPPTDSRLDSGRARQPITFRNSKIIYYGPHACENCLATICRMGREWGGNSFDYPAGPIYPNTEWHAHICDPAYVQRFSGLNGMPRE